VTVQQALLLRLRDEALRGELWAQKLLQKVVGQCFREVFGFLELPFAAQTLERYREPSVTRDPAKVRQPKVQEAISTEWIGRWPAPEHAPRIEALMRHPLAPDTLERAGYA
jgi:hypothetical protein